MRKFGTSFLDKALNECDRFLKIVAQKPQTATKPTPGHNPKDLQLTAQQKSNIQGLMRINHTGEVCAQALYYGQALFAKDTATKKHLLKAADEEHDHLYWCQERLDELQANSSLLNPFWYASSFALGASAALFGDKISYGFVMEIEKQVEDHLQEHIEQIPTKDSKTHAILAQMQQDEIRHGNDARAAGGVDLPKPVKKIMGSMSKFMKFLVYRI